MHTDLSSHLHTDECNRLIAALFKCRENNRFGQFFGECSPIEREMSRCLKKERLAKRQLNYEKAARRNFQKRSEVKTVYDRVPDEDD